MATIACAQPAPLDLTGVKAIADRGDWGSAVEAPEAIDGKADTWWNSGPMSLHLSPANLLLVLPEPRVVGALELDTVVSKNALRLTDFEVYGRAGEGWRLLGKVEKGTETAHRLDFKPISTNQFRIRLRDNARPDHCWACVAEVQLYAANGPAEPAVAAPVAEETVGERMFVAAALGELQVPPRTQYDPAKGYLCSSTARTITGPSRAPCSPAS
jgi:hypothetical protein